jgi:hypothetical protein
VPVPDGVALTVALELNIDFETGDGAEQFVQTYETLLADGYDIRYIVDLYRQPGSGSALPPRERRLITTETAMPAGGVYHFSEALTLPAERYIALVWVDFVPKGTRADFYYRTDDLQAVTIDNSRPYRGYHISKDAFTATGALDLATAQKQDARVEATVPVKRPFALYRIIATDAKEYRAQVGATYATRQPGTTRLVYRNYFPMGYNVYWSVPSESGFDNSGVHYDYPVPETTEYDTEVELAADFVFVKDAGDFYDADFGIYTPAGTLIGQHNGKITLQRNRVTVIRGNFLTTGGAGGAGINFEFDEEIIIPI